MVEMTIDQSLERTTGNLITILLIATAYAKDVGQTPEDWGQYCAKKVHYWNGMKGSPAIDICQQAVLNHVSMGATLVSVEGGEESATGVFDWNLDDPLAFIGIGVDDVEKTFDVFFKDICEHLGLIFTLERDGNRWTYTMSYE